MLSRNMLCTSFLFLQILYLAVIQNFPLEKDQLCLAVSGIMFHGNSTPAGFFVFGNVANIGNNECTHAKLLYALITKSRLRDN